MASIANLSVILTANTTKFSNAFKKQTKTINLFGSSVSSLVTRLASITGAIKLGQMVHEVDTAMHSSLAIMGDVSEQMKTQMIGVANEIAKGTRYSTAEAAKAYYYLASAGLSAAQSIKSLSTVATFAQAGMFDLSTATDLLTDTQMAMGLASKDTYENLWRMKRVGDVLVKANVLSNASVQQFSESLTNKAAASAVRFGQSIEQATAVLAAFASRGIKGADAGTQYDIILRNLSIKANENAVAFKAAGVEVYDSAGKFRFLGDIVADLEQSLEGLSDQQKVSQLMAMGFTAKTISSTSALMGMSGAITDYHNKLQDAKGTMEEVSEKQLPEITKGWERLKAAATETGGILNNTLNAMGQVMTIAGQVLGGGPKSLGSLTSLRKEEKQKAKELFEKGLKPEEVAKELGLPIKEIAGQLRTIWDKVDVKKAPEPPKALISEDVISNLEQAEKKIDSVKSKVYTLTDVLNGFGVSNDKLSRLGDIGKRFMEGAADAYTKAKEKQNEHNKLMEHYQDRAKRIFDQTRTPLEKFNSTMDELNNLLQMGEISWDTYGRAKKAALEQLDAGGPTGGPQMLEAGSAAAQRFVYMQQRGGNTVEDRQLSVQQEIATNTLTIATRLKSSEYDLD